MNQPTTANFDELLRGNYGLVLAGGTKHRYDSGGTYIPTLGLDDSPPALLPNARPPPIDRERETTPFLHRLVLTYVLPSLVGGGSLGRGMGLPPLLLQSVTRVSSKSLSEQR